MFARLTFIVALVLLSAPAIADDEDILSELQKLSERSNIPPDWVPVHPASELLTGEKRFTVPGVFHTYHNSRQINTKAPIYVKQSCKYDKYINSLSNKNAASDNNPGFDITFTPEYMNSTFVNRSESKRVIADTTTYITSSEDAAANIAVYLKSSAGRKCRNELLERVSEKRVVFLAPDRLLPARFTLEAMVMMRVNLQLEQSMLEKR